MSICRWNAEETDDNVLGSGADSWSWYRSGIRLENDTDGVYVVKVDNPNDDGTLTKRFTRANVRKVVTEIGMGKHGVNDTIRGYVKNDDLDAVAMDCVLQIVMFGEVVYG